MMSNIMRNIATIVLACFISTLSAQINLKYISNKKANYQIGDRIELYISLKTNPKTCQDGMDKVKIYVSGLSIMEQSEWKKSTPLIWQKTIQLEVIEHAKDRAKLTILRKVDKEDLFYQELFTVLK